MRVIGLTAADGRKNVDKIAMHQFLVQHGLVLVDTQRSHLCQWEANLVDQVSRIGAICQLNTLERL